METTEDESSLFRGREKEEFILFMLEMLCGIGAMVAIVIGTDYRESDPNAMLISMSVVLLLFGFIFDRGAINSQIPSILGERVWWVGPVAFSGLVLLQLLITGDLFPLTIDVIALFGIFIGFWIVGAGLKRMLVRGRFGQAYRGMVARTGESRFQLDRGLLIIVVVFMAFINSIFFVIDYENFPMYLSTSVMFIIFVVGCLSFKTEDKEMDWVKTSESSEDTHS